MMTDRTRGLALILWTGALWALYGLDVDTPLRAAVAIAYLLVAPGLAVISLLDLDQAGAVAILAVALSLGIVTVVATALLLANLWTPGRALAIVGCVTVIAAAARFTIVTRQDRAKAAGLSSTERREHGQ